MPFAMDGDGHEKSGSARLSPSVTRRLSVRFGGSRVSTSGLGTRTTVGQAEDLVMARSGVRPGWAIQMLQRVSSVPVRAGHRSPGWRAVPQELLMRQQSMAPRGAAHLPNGASPQPDGRVARAADARRFRSRFTRALAARHRVAAEAVGCPVGRRRLDPPVLSRPGRADGRLRPGSAQGRHRP
jgi:hypothetical protein